MLCITGGNEKTVYDNYYQTVPAKVMDNVVTIGTSADHTMAIKNDGSLWGWGSNGDGQVGIGKNADTRTPVKIIYDVVCVSAGSMHTFAVKKDGSLWAWGYNGLNQLLLPDDVYNAYTPVHVMDNIQVPLVSK